MEKWCVAHTQPQKEDVATKNLLDQDFEVYCPKFKKLRRHARRVDEILVPLFPRYLFVRIDMEVHGWRAINGTRGVQYLLVQDNKPRSVPDKVIEELKNQESNEGIVPIESLSLFTAGDKVEVLEGPLKGQIAYFDKFSDKDRSLILVEFLGRHMKVPITSSHIIPV